MNPMSINTRDREANPTGGEPGVLVLTKIVAYNDPADMHRPINGIA